MRADHGSISLKHNRIEEFETHKLGLDDDAAMLNSPQQLIRHLAFKIDGYDNRERRHATLGYLSPIDDETKCINTRTLPRVEP